MGVLASFELLFTWVSFIFGIVLAELKVNSSFWIYAVVLVILVTSLKQSEISRSRSWFHMVRFDAPDLIFGSVYNELVSTC